MLSRLSYANVIATVALFLALCGSSYAALTLPKGSVGPKQLQKNSVISTEGQARFPAQERSQEVRAPELAGRAGAAGAAGAPGSPGPSDATNVVMRRSAFQLILPDTTKGAPIDCLPGEVATGGGIEVSNRFTGDMMAITSRPLTDAADKPTGWTVRAFNVDRDEDDADTISVRAYAICASP
jgi:hypothetical protein